MNENLKLCYPSKNYVPPLGWFVVWEGQDVHGGDWYDLVDKCQKVTIGLGKIPSPNFEKLVEHALCERVSSQCKPCNKVAQTLGFMAIVRWVKAMYAFATQGKFELVSQEEAERRADICMRCPMQVSTSGCWGCKGIAGMLPAIAGARKTSFDAQLKACGVCGCYNAVAVHLPVAIQGSKDLEFPEWCWKRPSPPQIG
jgi:hypothetical protein